LKRPQYLAFILICGSVFMLFLVLRSIGTFEYLELAAYDTFIRWLPRTSAKASHITLVRVTEDDIEKYGWPLSDAVLAQALTNLLEHQPRAVGLDIFKDLSVPPGEEELRAVMTENRNIVVPMKFGAAEDLSIRPPPALAGTEQVGFNDILVDPGGIVRRGLLFLDDGKQVFHSFALRLAILYLAGEKIIPKPDPDIPSYIRLGTVTIRPFGSEDGGYVRADDQGYQFLLDYQRGSHPFPSYSLNRILTKDIKPFDINGKVTIIGFDSQGVKDFFYTPFSRRLKYDQQITGIALHAHIADQLIRFGLGESRPVTPFSESIEILFLLITCFLGVALSAFLRSVWSISMAVLSGVILLGLTFFLLFNFRIWVSAVTPAIAFVSSAAMFTGYKAATEKKERGMLMQLFSQHLSPEIAEDIWRRRSQFLKEGRPIPRKLTDTILFADLSGFTSVSEKMPPGELLGWLNTFMESMSNIIMEHGGIIDEFIGDGLKADFGVPIPRNSPDEIRKDAVNAVKCALEMERELDRLNDVWRTETLPNVRMRIGITTGEVVAGSLGSSRRLQYTTIGDTVNIASRLESLELPADLGYHGKSYSRILLSEATYRLVDGPINTERIGEFELKGRKEKIAVYRVIGRQNPARNGG